MMKVLITGATGFVGQRLVQKLSKSHKLVIVSRNSQRAEQKFQTLCPENDFSYVEWNDFESTPDLSEHRNLDGVVNLMGESVAGKRWSDKQKKILEDSRIKTSQLLFESLKENKIHLKFFINSSAIGFYGDQKDKVLDENSSKGDGFLADLVSDWEKVSEEHKSLYDRKTTIRIGIVLGKNGGAMSKMLPAFKLGLGGKIGSGEQYMSWIHLDDLVSILCCAIEDREYTGIINAVSEFPATNFDFTKTLATLLARPYLFSVPKLALSLGLGEMKQILLDSQRVKSLFLKEKKFHFKYPTLEIALKDVVSRQRK